MPGGSPSNFISGFILILGRSIKPGEVISIGGKFGWVEEMRARYIAVRDRDGDGDHGIELELRIWISGPQNGVTNVASDVNLTIWRLFKEHDITIPFPQLTAHLPQPPDGVQPPSSGEA